MRSLWIAILALLPFVPRGYGQGLVLKHVHSSSTHQQTEFMLGNGVEQAEAVWLNNLVAEYGAWDYNGDGVQDYVVLDRVLGSDQMKTVQVYGLPDFSLLWSSAGDLPSQVSWGTPLFFDLDGDHFKEIVYYGEQTLSVFSPTQHLCLLTASTTYAKYMITDYEGDGVLDIGLRREVPGEEYHIEIWGAGTVSSSAPTNLVIQPAGFNLILNWQPVDSCSMYDIQWCFVPNGLFASIGTSCVPTFAHPGAAIVPRAYYRVVAITSTDASQAVGNAAYTKNAAAGEE